MGKKLHPTENHGYNYLSIPTPNCKRHQKVPAEFPQGQMGCAVFNEHLNH